MKNSGIVTAYVLILCAASTALSLITGDDILVPAAARGPGLANSTWVTDLMILNPGDETVGVEIQWLDRNQANPAPQSLTYQIAGGATLVLVDVILNEFDRTTAGGAFRIMADAEVAVNSRIYNLQDGVTFGQGFEGIPRGSAVTSGGSTHIMGLGQDSRFRTNIVLLDASDADAGSRVELSLRDPSGDEIAGRTYDLDRLEPRLIPVSELGAADFTHASLNVQVTRGAAIVAASKVDNDPATGDPTTLEAWISQGAAMTVNGTYLIAFFDSFDFAGGGRLTVADGAAAAISATYFNWDKTDLAGSPHCREIFYLSQEFDPPFTLDELAQGIVIDQEFAPGRLSFILTLAISENLEISGNIDAVGSYFPLISDGCNGAFPSLEVAGGKGR